MNQTPSSNFRNVIPKNPRFVSGKQYILLAIEVALLLHFSFNESFP